GSGAGGAAEGTADVLSAAAEAGAGVVHIAAGAGAVSARAEDEAGAARLEEALEARGWSAERDGSEVRGRKTP
ncbi:MAG: hypothetical protein IK066_12990, partial [Kiritimatiellae bacterium]|nr:hypothetical protein [Kiritimatiellia bacterium]